MPIGRSARSACSAAAQRHHAAELALQHELRRAMAKAGREDAIKRRGLAAALHVAEHRRAHLALEVAQFLFEIAHAILEAIHPKLKLIHPDLKTVHPDLELIHTFAKALKHGRGNLYHDFADLPDIVLGQCHTVYYTV